MKKRCSTLNVRRSMCDVKRAMKSAPEERYICWKMKNPCSPSNWARLQTAVRRLQTFLPRRGWRLVTVGCEATCGKMNHPVLLLPRRGCRKNEKSPIIFQLSSSADCRLQSYFPRIVSPLRGLMVLTITFDRKLRKLAYGYLRVLPLRGLKRQQTTD